MSNAIPENALVVVADGGKASLFRRTGTGFQVHLRAEGHVTPDSLKEQGPAGARPGDQTPKQTGEASFVNHLAHHLQSMHGQGQFKHLVLVADPQSLGQIREAMHKSLEATVVRSVSKDLTNHPLPQIEAALSD